ncbi:MAG: undecaprenyl/decaprenyl-phosphate alpha-N-acetylglucosaminyl 1-phosphate transferase [Acidobacteria bacterium]|nr:undecaprenyl/decaprenyl-phosphate alpha-N-acetylglucosaminyl 1-phosphate transferase [Acidobacteriota bacterium]
MMNLHVLLALSAGSFLLTLVLTPLVRNAFLSHNLVDEPDGGRKLHQRAVPRIGGIPIAIAYVAPFALLSLLSPAGESPLGGIPLIVPLILSAGIVFLTGLLDDVIGLAPWQKLAGQVLAAAGAYFSGVRIFSLAGIGIPEWLGLPITLIWLVMCSNAFNLIDGLDGLASGMGLFATLTTFLAALLHGNEALALVTLPLAGALLGFLRYNFNPASVFLGDSGSLLIGFLLGSYGVIWSQKSATLLGMTAPFMALAIPLLDVCLSIVRRWLRGRPIFSADRGHIHHRLLDLGWTQRRAVLVLYAVCGFYAALSLLQSVLSNQVGGLVILLFCLATWAGIQHLGYHEFNAAGRTLRSGAVQRLVHGQIAIHAFEKRIRTAGSAEECWQVIRESSEMFDIVCLQASLRGEPFQLGHPQAETPSWQLRIPLGDGNYVNLWCAFGRNHKSAILIPWVESLRVHVPAALLAMEERPQSSPTDVDSLVQLAQEVGPSAAAVTRAKEAV